MQGHSLCQCSAEYWAIANRQTLCLAIATHTSNWVKSCPTFNMFLHYFTGFLVETAVLKASFTPRGFRVVQTSVNGQTRCSGVFPRVLSPLSSQVEHAYSPLKFFIFITAALAGKSAVKSNSIPLLLYTPSGVTTSKPACVMH